MQNMADLPWIFALDESAAAASCCKIRGVKKCFLLQHGLNVGAFHMQHTKELRRKMHQKPFFSLLNLLLLMHDLIVHSVY